MDTISYFLELCSKYQISWFDIYEAYLVPTMLSNNIKYITTFNLSDFEKYKEVVVIEPSDFE